MGRYETGVVHGAMPDDRAIITPTNRGIHPDRQFASSRRPSKEGRSIQTALGLHERVKVGVKVQY